MKVFKFVKRIFDFSIIMRDFNSAGKMKKGKTRHLTRIWGQLGVT
jgi:hypothetical protein